jgi:hypothetical protein
MAAFEQIGDGWGVHDVEGVSTGRTTTDGRRGSKNETAQGEDEAAWKLIVSAS